MFGWLRAHLTFANVVSLMALFVALSGGAYALTLPRNSVGAEQLKRNAVRSSKIKNSAVTSSKVKDASLLSKDFRPGQLPSGPQGPQGPQGVQGVPGTSGPVGPTFASAFSNPQTPTPPATPDSPVLNGQYSHTFVTPRSGRLLVFASLKHLSVTCSVGNGNAFLYLDGVGVPGSGQLQPNITPADPYTPIALTGVVPAGEHTLTIDLDCPMGNKMSDSSSGDGKLGAVLIGS